MLMLLYLYMVSTLEIIVEEVSLKSFPSTFMGAVSDGYGCSAYGTASSYNSCQLQTDSKHSNTLPGVTGILPVTGGIASFGLGLAIIAAATALMVSKRRSRRKSAGTSND